MFGNSSTVQLGYAKESAFGVIPVVGNYKLLRMTGESLDYAINKETSAEINATRTVSSQVPVSAAASGGVNAEISYLEYDDLIESVLQSTYGAYGTNGVGTTFTAAFTATTITASVAPVGTSDFTSLKKGQFFKINAPGALNDGKIARVSKTVAPTTTVITVEASTPLLVEAAIANTTLSTSRLTNGATQSSFTLERQSADITEYWAYTGMTPSSMEVNASSGARSTLAFNFMGKAASRGTVTALPGVATPSHTYEIHSGASGPVCLLWVDGAPLAGTYVNSMKMSYSNNLREQNAMCSLSAVGIGSGTIQLTGTMEVYFANGALFDKFISNTNIELTFSTLDAAGNGYIFTIPKANLGKVTTQAGGKDQDMMLSIDFTGLRDDGNATAALRQLLFIDRVGAAAV